MKKMLRLSLPYIFICLSIYFPACQTNPTDDETNSATANTKVTEAYAEMENIFSAPGSIQNKNFSKAEQLYTEAVQADPNNPAANFGAAFTRMLGVFADSVVKNAVDRWEGFDPGGPVPPLPSMLDFRIPSGTQDMAVPTALLGRNIIKMIQVATTDPPTITEMQNILKTRLLPRIDYAIARLAVVETNQNFEMRISGKMQGRPTATDVYLDLTEVYVMDAALHSMKALVEQFLIFQFSLDGYDTKFLVPALQQNNTTFFVLAADGASHAQNVKSSLSSAVSKIKNGINFLKSETDLQDDDIIKIGSNGIKVKNLDTTLVYLDKAQASLTGTISIDFEDADSDHNTYTIQISLNNFFNNLPQNPKQAWFPTYTVDTTANGHILWRWEAQDYASFTFPDPTFSGLFPNMTNDILKRILYIDEEFAWRVSVNVNDAQWPPDVQSMKLVINGKEYLSKNSSYYGNFEFLVNDNNNMPVQSITAVSNSQDVPLMFVGDVPSVRLKQYDYISADVTRASQNITAEHNAQQNSISVSLYDYGYYIIERAVNAGGFVKIDSMYTSYYTDNNISASTSYKYRALRGLTWYGWGFSAIRPNNYTNEVTVNVP